MLLPLDVISTLLPIKNKKHSSFPLRSQRGAIILFTYFLNREIIFHSKSIFGLSFIAFLMPCIYFWYIQMGQWHAADEYEGQVRELTYRSLCHSPMCPPDTAMTEYQHVVLSEDKKKLVWRGYLFSYSILSFNLNYLW